jgi:HK97 family phage portal protein
MLFDLFNKNDATSGDETRSGQWYDAGGAVTNTKTLAGVSVTQTSALAVSAVWGCVRIISDGVATLPIKVTRGEGSESTLATVRPVWLDTPNKLHTPVEFKTQLMWSLLLDGNAFVLISRDNSSNQILELHVLDPAQVSINETNPLAPIYTANGKIVPREQMLHIRGYMLPGRVRGLSPIEYQRETIGLSLAALRFGESFYGNSGIPSVVIEHPTTMSPEGASVLKSSWESMHKGPEKSNGVAVITEGATLKQLTIAPEQAQFLATRGFQVADVARIYGVPPHLIADATNSTSWGSGLAEQSTNYVTHTLRPWVERIEEAFTALARSERPTVAPGQKMHVTLRMDHLLRGDFAARHSTYGQALATGIYTINEVRGFEGLPAVEGGDNVRVPLNTAPIDLQDKQHALKEEELALKSDDSAGDA